MRFIVLSFLFFVGCATFEVVSTNPLLSNAYVVEAVDSQRVHLLHIDLNKYMVRPIKAKGLAYPTTLASTHKALAALNGGFFQADGTPAGLLVIDSKIMGYQSKPRAALGWSANHDNLVVDRLLCTASQKKFASATNMTTAREWETVDFAIGGTPLLIRDHKLLEDFSVEKVRDQFLSLKHARTAICIRSPKHWIFVAVEGSSSLELSPFGRSGFTMNELAQYMFNVLQCTHAINLDGGGSTALVIDNKLMNATTYGEREVSDVLAVFPRSVQN